MNTAPAQQDLVSTLGIDDVLKSGVISEEVFRQLGDYEEGLSYLKTRLYFGYGLYIQQKEEEHGKDYIAWLESETHLREHTIRKCQNLTTEVQARFELGQEYLDIVHFPISQILKTPRDEKLEKKARKLPSSSEPKPKEIAAPPTQPEPDSIDEPESVIDIQQELDDANKTLRIERARVQELELEIEESKTEEPEPEVGEKEEEDDGTWIEIPDPPSSTDPEEWEPWIQSLNESLVPPLMDTLKKFPSHNLLRIFVEGSLKPLANYIGSRKPKKNPA